MTKAAGLLKSATIYSCQQTRARGFTLSTSTVREILAHRGFTSDHERVIAEAIANGYDVLAKLILETPMLSKFGPGIANMGNLRNIAVQFALDAAAAETQLFHTELRLNDAKNHVHLRLSVERIIFTAHYLGKDGTNPIREAINRAELAQRNGDLFAGEAYLPDIGSLADDAYVQITHSGNLRPDVAALFVPDRNQKTYSLEPLILSVPEPSNQRVEQIESNLMNQFELISRQEHQQNGEELSAGAPKAG